MFDQSACMCRLIRMIADCITITLRRNGYIYRGGNSVKVVLPFLRKGIYY